MRRGVRPRSRRRVRLPGRKQVPCGLELVDIAGRAQAVVADADEAPGQDVQQEGDLAVGEGDDAMVRDGDAVGVAAQIAEDVLGAAKGRLGGDDPLLGVELLLERLPRQRMDELGRGASEVELAFAMCLVQRVEKQAAEKPRWPRSSRRR